MLRNNTESFAPELLGILSDLGVRDEVASNGFQLLKFERVEPDVFVWLLRASSNYLVTLHDGGSRAPNRAWLANWCGGLASDELELLLPRGVNPAEYAGLENGYDFVHVYRLPEEYDHCDYIEQYA